MGLAHTVSQHAREMRTCLTRGATFADRSRLVRDTVRFHVGNRLGGSPDFASAAAYRVSVAGRTCDLELRLGAGDFFVFHEVFTNRCYRLPASWVDRIRTVVDLGAHIGLTSLYLLESLPQARIVCVEATPDNAAVLRHNLAAFSDRATVIEAAIAAAPGTARFQSAGWSWERRLGGVAGDDAAGFDVRCETVDGVMRHAGLTSIDLLKIDVEGAEQAILAGGPAWLSAVDAIVIELHEPYSLEDFAADVRPRGFRVLTPSSGSGTEMIMAIRDTAAGAVLATAS